MPLAARRQQQHVGVHTRAHTRTHPAVWTRACVRACLHSDPVPLGWSVPPLDASRPLIHTEVSSARAVEPVTLLEMETGLVQH